MPYQAGKRLPRETASKLGHLEVLQSELVNQLCESFEDTGPTDRVINEQWENVDFNHEQLNIVVGVDGSLQTVRSDLPPYKTIAFVKTALLRLDEYALARVDKQSPHPFELRDIMASSAVYHATVFPLRNVTIPGMSIYHAVRKIIFDSLCDPSLQREPLETLKWIAYEKWDGIPKNVKSFECPHCESQNATLPYDAEVASCPECHGELFISDMLGFHLDMTLDAASDAVPAAYMNIHELLMLFTGVRLFWERTPELLKKTLFVKDGPLSIRAQYSKLVAPIRRFFAFAKARDIDVHLVGQEKSGRFFDHLDLIGRAAPHPAVFVPDDSYIKAKIQQRSDGGSAYGKDTNFGAKVFLKVSEYHQMVLNVPTNSAKFVTHPKLDILIGIDNILATLPRILSNRHEGALLPIELAHGVASLSSYPSAQILKIFADTKAKR